MKKLKKLKLEQMEKTQAGGIGSCIRRHQRWIRTAVAIGSPREIINGLVEDAQGCYDGTNLI